MDFVAPLRRKGPTYSDPLPAQEKKNKSSIKNHNNSSSDSSDSSNDKRETAKVSKVAVSKKKKDVDASDPSEIKRLNALKTINEKKAELAEREKIAKRNKGSMAIQEDLRFESRTYRPHADDQEWVLVVLANPNQRPHAKKPALYIIRSAPDRNDLVEFYMNHQKQFDDFGGTFIWPTGTWKPVCSSQEQQADPKYVENVVNRRLDAYEEQMKAEKAEFDKNVTKRKMGSRKFADDDDDDDGDGRDDGDNDDEDEDEDEIKKPKRKGKFAELRSKKINQEKARVRVLSKLGKTDQEIFDPVPKGYEQVGNFPTELENRSQKFALISFLKDTFPFETTMTEPESRVKRKVTAYQPIVRIYGCFMDQNDAVEYRKEIEDTVTQYALDVVCMYVPLPLQDIDVEKFKEEFRKADQQAVMDRQKKEKKKVRTLEELYGQTGLELPGMTFDDNGVTLSGNADKDNMETKTEISNKRSDRSKVAIHDEDITEKDLNMYEDIARNYNHDDDSD